MKTYRLFTVLALAISSLLLSCNEEEFPSVIPSKPYAIGEWEERECMNYVNLEVTGSKVEDDLKVEYVYYISTDNQHFDITQSYVSHLKPNTRYWWYAVAVSKNHDGKTIGTSETSDVYTFYSLEDPTDPTIPHEHSITILIVGDTEGASVSSEQLVGMSGDVLTVKFTIDDNYEIVDMTSGELSADGTLKVKVLNHDYYVIIEVRKRKDVA